MRKRILICVLLMLLGISGSFCRVQAAPASGLRPWQYGFGSSSDEDEGVQAMIDACGLEQSVWTGSQGRRLPYWIYVPKNDDGSVPENLPVVLYMHGYTDGGEGTRTVLRIHNGVFYRLMEQRERPDRQAIVLIPQTPQSASSGTDLADYLDRWIELGATSGTMNWNDWYRQQVDYGSMQRAANLTTVIELLQSVQTLYRADADRTYVTGMSMGGCAVWDLISRDDAKLFAAAVPICGIGDLRRAGNAADIPIRLFHGTLDPTVPCQASRLMYKALRKYGNITYTEYPKESHFAWNAAYSTSLDDDGNGTPNIDDLLDWMFNQSRRGTLDGSVDTAPLEQLIVLAQSARPSDYAAADWKNLQTAAGQAQSLLDEGSRDRQKLAFMAARLDEALDQTLPNLCLNRPVTESAHWQNDDGTKAVDGNLSTWWDSGMMSEDSALSVDLGQTCRIDQIRVVTWHGGSRFYHYQILGSADGKEWMLLGEKQDSALSTSQGTVHSPDTPQVVRWIRLCPLHNSANSSFHLCELEAYGIPVDLSLLDTALTRARSVNTDCFASAQADSLAAAIESASACSLLPESQEQILLETKALHQTLLDLRRIPVSLCADRMSL